jgi:hypothetical protein
MEEGGEERQNPMEHKLKGEVRRSKRKKSVGNQGDKRGKRVHH